MLKRFKRQVILKECLGKVNCWVNWLKKDVVEAHGKTAFEYDEICMKVGSHAHEVLFGLSYQYIQPDESILDIGIGTGISAELFRKAGLDVYGIDGSEEMLNVCRAKAFVKDLKTYDLSLGNWPYSAESFNHAVCCGVFHFYSDLTIFFKETQRVLKTGGTFGFTVIDKTDDDVWASDPTEVPLYCHSEIDLSLLFIQFGFSLLKSLSFYTFKTPDKRIKVPFTAYTVRKK
jgi:ubiquinone/menaquinone biosynthesis C-methylase UbiE